MPCLTGYAGWQDGCCRVAHPRAVRAGDFSPDEMRQGGIDMRIDVLCMYMVYMAYYCTFWVLANR